MSRLAGRWPVLAVSLVLGGCYVGLDEGERTTEAGAGSSSGATSKVTTGVPETGDTTGDAGDTTGGATADATMGTPGGSSGSSTDGDASTGGPVSTEPVTSGPVTTEAMTSAGTSGDETTGADDSGLPPPVDVPDNGYCGGVGNWDPAWAQLELDVLALVNQVRAQGVDCHSKGVFAATGPLKMDPSLRCAARKHSADMAARDFFDHTNPDGELPWDRMGKAGYGGYSNAGENIAAGSPDAQGTMDQWLGSDGHCANIMSPNFQDIGVGYSPGGQYGHLWTQVFGAK